MVLQGSGSHGQILVVAALLIAVLFVGLALVLNGAIYAENLASQGETSTSGTVATDAVTEDRLGQMVDTANYEVEEASYADRRQWIDENATQWDKLMGQREAQSGRAYVTETTAITNGTRVNQSEYRNFMPAEETLLDEVTDPLLGSFRIDPLGLGDKKNWIIANDTQLRDFEMRVQRDSLYEKDPSTLTEIIEVTNAVLTGSKLFWLEIDHRDASDEFRRVYLLDDTSNNSVEAVVVEFDDGSGTITGRCSAPGENVTVRLTAGEMVGDDGPVSCPDLQEATAGENANFYYAGADEVYGTYQFISDKEETTFRNDLEDRYGLFLENTIDALADLLRILLGGDPEDDDIYYDSPTGDGPYTTTAIYDVTVETTYRDNRITYMRNVTYPSTAR